MTNFNILSLYWLYVSLNQDGSLFCLIPANQLHPALPSPCFAVSGMSRLLLWQSSQSFSCFSRESLLLLLVFVQHGRERGNGSLFLRSADRCRITLTTTHSKFTIMGYLKVIPCYGHMGLVMVIWPTHWGSVNIQPNKGFFVLKKSLDQPMGKVVIRKKILTP